MSHRESALEMEKGVSNQNIYDNLQFRMNKLRSRQCYNEIIGNMVWLT